jgi:hypothetical protein
MKHVAHFVDGPLHGQWRELEGSPREYRVAMMPMISTARYVGYDMVDDTVVDVHVGYYYPSNQTRSWPTVQYEFYGFECPHERKRR